MEIRSFPSLASLSAAAATWIAELSTDAIAARGRFTIALSGGSTPRTLYETLAREYQTKIDWNHSHIFWGDERFVPQNDPANNYRMAKEALLSHITVPIANVHPVPTAMTSAKDTAMAYSNALRSFFGEEVPTFDLVLLGLGGDGHTASLFPGMTEEEMNRDLVLATHSPVPPAERISLTLPVINNARNVAFLVAGEEKKDILKAVLSDRGNPSTKYPAARVNPRGKLVWFVDEASCN